MHVQVHYLHFSYLHLQLQLRSAKLQGYHTHRLGHTVYMSSVHAQCVTQNTRYVESTRHTYGDIILSPSPYLTNLVVKTVTIIFMSYHIHLKYIIIFIIALAIQ